MIWKNSHLPLAILMDEDLRGLTEKRYTADLWLDLTRTRTWLGLGLDSENGFTPPGSFILPFFTRKISIVTFIEGGYVLSRSQNDKTSNIW